jgi:hypothetical protein
MENNSNSECQWSAKEFNELLYFFKLTDLTYQNAWKKEAIKKTDEESEQMAESFAIEDSSSLAEHEQDPLEVKGIIDHLISASPHAPELLSVTKESFKPALFLQQIHKETTYSQFLEGISNLQQTIQHRTLRLSEAVKRNFTRFVDARNKATEIQSSLKNKELPVLFEQLKQHISGKNQRIFFLDTYSFFRDSGNSSEAFFSIDNFKAERTRN